jgi:hypothetical protein
MTQLGTRLAAFYVNTMIAAGVKAEQRVNDFLNTSKFARQDDLIKLRRGQYRDLFQAFGLSSYDFKWFTRETGDTLVTTGKTCNFIILLKFSQSS